MNNKIWVIFTTVLLCFSLCISPMATNIETDTLYNDIMPEIITIDSRSEGVTRLECIASIMKIIGVDENYAFYRADATYLVPIFWDVDGYTHGIYAGYVYLAKGYGIVVGVDTPDVNGTNHFDPGRYITVKETLITMLRCLTNPETLSWNAVMEESIRFGLLKEEELEIYVEDEFIKPEQLVTLLGRMLNQHRYIYWPTVWPTAVSPVGYGKMMQVDDSKTMKYVDWYIDTTEYYKQHTD